MWLTISVCFEREIKEIFENVKGRSRSREAEASGRREIDIEEERKKKKKRIDFLLERSAIHHAVLSRQLNTLDFLLDRRKHWRGKKERRERL